MVYPISGKFEKGVQVARKSTEIDPDFPVGYLQLAFNLQFLERFDEAENTLRRAAARKLDMPELAVQRYDVAFLKGDKAAMEREAALVRGKPAPEDLISGREGFVLAYSGHLQQARPIARRTADSALQAAQPGRAALWETGAALWEAFFGNVRAARRGALNALEHSKDRDVEYGAAFALAFSGESSRAQTLAARTVCSWPTINSPSPSSRSSPRSSTERWDTAFRQSRCRWR